MRGNRTITSNSDSAAEFKQSGVGKREEGEDATPAGMVREGVSEVAFKLRHEETWMVGRKQREGHAQEGCSKQRTQPVPRP